MAERWLSIGDTYEFDQPTLKSVPMSKFDLQSVDNPAAETKAIYISLWRIFFLSIQYRSGEIRNYKTEITTTPGEKMKVRIP